MNFPALMLGGLLNLGFLFGCTPSADEVKHETLEYKLNVERDSQTYVLEIKKGDLFIGINPVFYGGGRGGCLIEIYDEKSEDEAVKIMLELHDNGKSNFYAGEMRVNTPDFFMKFNKKQDKTEDEIYCKSWHVNGKLYDQFFTIIDSDGDGNPETIYYGEDKTIKLYSDKKTSLEKHKDIIAGAIESFLKSQKYINEIGDIESLKL